MKRFPLAAILLCGSLFLACQIASAQTTAEPATETGVKLRWKFSEGKNLNVMMTQDMKQEMKVAGQSMASNMVNKTWSQWRPTDVQDDGNATIVSEVSRVVMEIDNPATGKMVIDTDQAAAEEGQAAQLDAMIRPMVDVEITNAMSPRGKVSDVKIPEEVLAGLKGAVGGAMMSAEQMGEMMQKVSPIFPEEGLASGDTWKSKSEVATPVGNMKVDSKYTYEGTVEIEGDTLHSIKVEMNMDFEAPEGGPAIEFGDQDSTGIMLFDNEKGRLVRSDVEQSFTLKVNAAPGQVLEQKITQKMANVIEEAK